jgi:hypothetical protein
MLKSCERILLRPKAFRVCSFCSATRNEPHASLEDKKAFSYCQDLVRQVMNTHKQLLTWYLTFPSRNHDHDHYLCTLLLPRTLRAAAFAIRSFNVEVAQIADMVSERSIGVMRVEFWRTMLNSVYKVQ